MTDREFAIIFDFKKKKVASVVYLMRKFKCSPVEAFEYMKMLSNISTKDERNKNGDVVRVFL